MTWSHVDSLTQTDHLQRNLADPTRLKALAAVELMDTPAEAAFDRFTALAAEILDAPIALITLVDQQRQFFKSDIGLPEPLATDRETPLSHSLCAHVVATNEPLKITDARRDPRFDDHPAVCDLGIAAYLGVPLQTTDGITLGTLCVADQEPREWRRDALHILQRMSSSVITEIELRNLTYDVVNAYGDLQLDHAHLRVEHAFLNALLASSADLLGILDRDGSIRYVSPAITQVLGYQIAELIEDRVFSLIHPDDQDAVSDAFRELLSGAAQELAIDARVQHADGQWRMFELLGTNHLDTPAIQGIVINAHDVTERNQLRQALADHNRHLRSTVISQTHELDEARFEILERLALAAEYRDDVTGEHTRRVGQLASRLAQQLELPPEQVGYIERSAPLHDIGKIGISDQILLKPGRLTAAERKVMERHTEIGAGIVSGSDVPCLQMAEEIALNHHERWDGAGYPCGLRGEEIPLVGRIVAVADVLDALTHERPYKDAWPLDEALREIASQREHQFDPTVVDALLRLYYQHRAGSGVLAPFDKSTTLPDTVTKLATYSTTNT